MSSYTHGKGYHAEACVVAFIRGAGFPHAERGQAGALIDRGDILGTPGIAWEVRNRRALGLPAWLRDTRRRRLAAGADIGILVVKPEGIGATQTGTWAAVLTLADLCDLLTMAGYGTQTTVEVR